MERLNELLSFNPTIVGVATAAAASAAAIVSSKRFMRFFLLVRAWC
ncbi:MAG: hypothetical protein QOG01_1182 [Pseudonocardiales bacterium]|jgi:hypothetical protein|nr:hypothetical protein [Pseudonocardiales bacterium]